MSESSKSTSLFAEAQPGHVVLLGDSIFDNASYVPGQPPVVEQLREALPSGWEATLLAVDGHVTSDVARQLIGLPDGATHLVISTGGNDALGESGILGQRVRTVGEALHEVHEVYREFDQRYRQMLEAVARLRRAMAVCTVYDAIPGLGPAERTALGGFNEVILRAAFDSGLPVIDLRLVCDQRADYSPLSPIEPSSAGGAKIAQAIAELVTRHDFAARRSTIYVGRR